MKLVFYGPNDSPALQLLGELPEKFNLAQLQDIEGLKAILQEGELTVVVMDFDDENFSVLIEEAKKQSPHLKIILTSVSRQAKDFREHQLNDSCADGYLRAPIDAAMLEDILESFAMAFTADSPEAPELHGATMDINTEVLVSEGAESPLEDPEGPPPLDPEQRKIIRETLEQHKISVDLDAANGPPPFDNSLNKRIQGVFDSVFKKTSSLDLGGAGELSIENKKPPISQKEAEEIEFNLDIGDTSATDSPKEEVAIAADEKAPELSLDEQDEPVVETAQDVPTKEKTATGIELDVSASADELSFKTDNLDTNQDASEEIMATKPSPQVPQTEGVELGTATETPTTEDDKQTVQFDLAKMKAELEGTAKEKGKELPASSGPEVDIDFAAVQNISEDSPPTEVAQADKAAAFSLEEEAPAATAQTVPKGGLELSMGTSGGGLELDINSDGAAENNATPSLEATKKTAISQVDLAMPAEASIEEAPAAAPEPTGMTLDLSTAEVPGTATTIVSFENKTTPKLGEKTADIPIPDNLGPVTQSISINAAPTSVAPMPLNTDHADVKSTQVVSMNLTGPKNPINTETTSQQDRPHGGMEYRAYVENKKEHEDILAHHSSEQVRLAATIRNLREDREQLLKKIAKLEDEKINLRQEALNARAELDEVKIENSILKKRHQEEKEILSFEAKMIAEKKSYYEDKIRLLSDQLRTVEHKVKLDINRVLAREKELEGKLELLRADSDLQIRSREDKIIELKKKIDLLEFDMENIASFEKNSKETNAYLEEKLSRVMKTMKMAIKMLENEDVMDNVTPILKAK